MRSALEPMLAAATQRPPMPPTVDATRVVRALRGGSMSFLMEAEDGNCYIVKFSNNPQHRRTLVNELLGWRILTLLGISTPPVAYVRVTARLIEESPCLQMHRGSVSSLASVGLHFGSQFPGDPKRDVVYDFVPQVIFDKIINRADFYGALVVDKWTATVDSRQAVFVRKRNTPSRLLCAYMIDNGQLFGGKSWRFHDGPLYGLYRDRAVYASGKAKTALEPWLSRVMDLRSDLVLQTIYDAPGDWIADDAAAVERLIEKLFSRKNRLSSLLEECMNCL